MYDKYINLITVHVKSLLMELLSVIYTVPYHNGIIAHKYLTNQENNIQHLKASIYLKVGVYNMWQILN